MFGNLFKGMNKVPGEKTKAQAWKDHDRVEEIPQMRERLRKNANDIAEIAGGPTGERIKIVAQKYDAELQAESWEIRNGNRKAK